MRGVRVVDTPIKGIDSAGSNVGFSGTYWLLEWSIRNVYTLFKTDV